MVMESLETDVYHVAPASRKKSIEREGVHAKGERRYSFSPHNIYVWRTEAQAKLYALGEASDFGENFHVWRGKVPTSSLELDPTIGDVPGSLMTNYPFKAQRIVGFIATPRSATLRAKDVLEMQVEIELEENPDLIGLPTLVEFKARRPAYIHRIPNVHVNQYRRRQ